jgi:enamine deaminase RidA (YjgF/YER057c/UK114 family)
MAQYFQSKTFLGDAYESNGYSQAVVLPVGAQLVIAAGHPAVNKEAKIPDSAREQVAACFDNCHDALKAAGVKDGLGSAHKVHCFLMDIKDEPVVMEVWKERYPNHRPTWMSVGINSLALPGMVVEIQVEAHI